mgnify:CR=1 FL=1
MSLLPPGVKGAPIPKIGYFGWKTWELAFDECRLPGSALIGEEGRAFYYISAGLERARAHTAARAIGLARDVTESYPVSGLSLEAPGFTPTRPQDKTFTGNIVQAMAAYASGQLGPQEVPLSDAAHMIVIGSDRMMAAVALARTEILPPLVAAWSANALFATLGLYLYLRART